MSCGDAEFCRGGDCVATCVGVECGATEVCHGGSCQPTGCDAPCGAGTVCDASSGSCVDDPCAGVSCDTGQVCDPAMGSCIDDPCRNITCPGEGVCRLGECVSGTSSMPDAGGSFDAGVHPDQVLAAGGFGCAVSGGAVAGGAVSGRSSGAPLGCGRCGQVCTFFEVSGAACSGGTCTYDPSTDCAAGYIDANGMQSDGCEYECTPSASGTETCNGLDDDCDGTTDEGFALDTDVNNCGRCGRVCSFPHATPHCGAGTCMFDPTTDCEPGYSDNDGVQLDGCEYPCTPTADPTEICDGLDNDCDGRVDGATADAGGACNKAPGGVATGVCTDTGSVTCVGGSLVCLGAPEPTVERCNGADDDCNGMVDDSPVDEGRVCMPAVGTCTAGVQRVPERRVGLRSGGRSGAGGLQRPRRRLRRHGRRDADRSGHRHALRDRHRRVHGRDAELRERLARPARAASGPGSRPATASTTTATG